MKGNKKKTNTTSAQLQDDAEPSGSSDTFSLDEISRLTNDPELVKRIKELKAEQDGELPNLGSHGGGQDGADRSLVRELHNEDKYRMEKAIAEAQIEKASSITAESKNFLSEMDDFLQDLEGWKKQRSTQQDAVGGAQAAASSEETKADEVDFSSNTDELRKLEEEFMRKTNEREQQILAQLKALNIDPEKATAKAQGATPTDEERSAEIIAKIAELNEREKKLEQQQILPGGKTYDELMKEIEEKEALLKQKEDEFRREAYEEIQLSENNQAKVDGRKKELEAVLANMQALENDFDDLDESYDAKLFALLQQVAPGGLNQSSPPSAADADADK